MAFAENFLNRIVSLCACQMAFCSKRTLSLSCISESHIEIKNNFYSYFHTSLWYLKKFYEGLKGLHKTF